MTSANGSLDFLRMEFCVGTALIVDRMYFEGQFEVGEAVTAVFNASIGGLKHKTVCGILHWGGC